MRRMLVLGLMVVSLRWRPDDYGQTVSYSP